MIGQTISHYRIIEKLGEGGMGVVYKALDTRLDRPVALKFLPQYLDVKEEDRTRFIHEAKAASALDHPNVGTIYEVGETDDGQLFIAMAFYAGETLKQKIDRGPLPIDEAARIALQLCDGLSRAHEAGITHRDIKPANIIVTDRGEAKIVDFGLAKLTGQTRVTKTGATVGTTAYMSPEQIRGEPVDGRSDIFSAGIVIYEMLAGRLPFRGEHEAAMMYSILNEKSEPVSTYFPDASSELVQVLDKALEKEQDARYQSMTEMIVDLRRSREGSSLGGHEGITPVEPAAKTFAGNLLKRRISAFLKKRKAIAIALAGLLGIIILVILVVQIFWPVADVEGDMRLVVLPFQNQGSPEKDYFADGITEEITGSLSGLSRLAVIARSSAMLYKKTTKTVNQIGEELGVSHILMGTVRWEQRPDGEDRVRVRTELINAREATQIWSEPFESPYSASFGLQSRIALQVATALGLTLAKGEQSSPEEGLTPNAEAYHLYLQAKDYVSRGRSKTNLSAAEKMLEEAVELDPDFAAAYASLSKVHSDMYWAHYDRSAGRLEKSKQAADRSLSLVADLPDGYTALGLYYYHGKLDYENGLKYFRLALERAPSNNDAVMGIGAVLRRQGKLEESLGYFQKAAVLDPRSVAQTMELGYTLSLLRRYEEAQRYFDRGISLAPDWTLGWTSSSWNQVHWKGDLSRARKILTEAIDVGIPDPRASLTASLALMDYLDRDYAAAEEKFSKVGVVFDDLSNYLPSSLMIGSMRFLTGRGQEAKGYFESARASLEERIRESPEDSRLYSTLAMAYAGLGRKRDAIQTAEHAVELLPVSKEHLAGLLRLRDLAKVYAMVGEDELAINLLRKILNMPGGHNYLFLELDQVWDPLRNNPKFQQLLRDNAR